MSTVEASTRKVLESARLSLKRRLVVDFASTGIPLMDQGNSTPDVFINNSTVGARITHLFETQSQDVTRRASGPFLQPGDRPADWKPTDESAVFLGRRYNYEDRVLRVDGKLLARQIDLKPVTSSQDEHELEAQSIKVLEGEFPGKGRIVFEVTTFASQAGQTLELCKVTEGNSTKAYIGRIAWDEYYKKDVAKTFGLLDDSQN